MSDNIPLSKYKHLTDVQVMQCLTLAKTSWKIRKIADEVGCSKSTVGHVLQDHDYKTFTVGPKSSGCPRKTTEHEDRLIVRTAKAIIDFLSKILPTYTVLQFLRRQQCIDVK